MFQHHLPTSRLNPACPRQQSAPFSRQIVGLDLLRIFAAALVVVYHLAFYDWSPRAQSPGPPLHDFDRFQAFTNFGWVGVEIFFVISGFVIAYSAQAARAPVFAVQRLLRLLPAALICGTLSAIALYSQGNTPAPRVFSLWLRSVCLRPLPGIDGSYWTLPIEVAFYGLVFLLLLFHGIRRMPIVMGALGGLSTLFWLMTPIQLRLPKPLYTWAFKPLQRAALETQSLVWFGSAFAVGVFLWLCLNQRCTLKRLLMLAICSVGTLFELLLRGNTLAHECATRYRAVLPAGLWLLSVAFIVLAVRCNAPLQRLLGRRGVALSRRLGMMTYPLYLVHHTVGFTLIQRMRFHLGAANALLVAIGIVTAIAGVIAGYPEPAIQKWARGALQHWTHPASKSVEATPLPVASRAARAAILSLPAPVLRRRSTKANAARPAA